MRSGQAPRNLPQRLRPCACPRGALFFPGRGRRLSPVIRAAFWSASFTRSPPRESLGPSPPRPRSTAPPTSYAGDRIHRAARGGMDWLPADVRRCPGRGRSKPSASTVTVGVRLSATRTAPPHPGSDARTQCRASLTADSKKADSTAHRPGDICSAGAAHHEHHPDHTQARRETRRDDQPEHTRRDQEHRPERVCVRFWAGFELVSRRIRGAWSESPQNTPQGPSAIGASAGFTSTYSRASDG